MKKIISAILCLLLILSTAFCLEGCKTRTDEMGEQSVYTEKQMNKIKNKIFKYVNEQDKEGLKKLFSKDAQKHIEDLDGKLDQFIGAFNRNKIESAKGLGPNFKGSIQTQPLHIYGKYHLVLNSKEKYRIYISLCDKNDEESDKEGVFQIELRTFSREESPKDFSGGAYQDDYGIFIYTLQTIQRNKCCLLAERGAVQ